MFLFQSDEGEDISLVSDEPVSSCSGHYSRHRYKNPTHSKTRQRRYFTDCSAGKVDEDAVSYCERFLELLTDLVAQLPTRRFFNTLMDSSHFLVIIITSWARARANC